MYNTITNKLNTKANSSDVTNALYFKSDKSTRYTKTEVDSALSNKANQLTNYTKTVSHALSITVPTINLSSLIYNDSSGQDKLTRKKGR